MQFRMILRVISIVYGNDIYLKNRSKVSLAGERTGGVAYLVSQKDIDHFRSAHRSRLLSFNDRQLSSDGRAKDF